MCTWVFIETAVFYVILGKQKMMEMNQLLLSLARAVFGEWGLLELGEGDPQMFQNDLFWIQVASIEDT